MKLGRCPVCHSHLDLAALVQDDAARELLATLTGLDATLSRALVAYLALWRPAKQDLSWQRALRIARETLSMDADAQRLSHALAQTVDALRAKAAQLPLRSHGYLRRVLDATPATQPHEGAVVTQPQRRAASRTAEAMRRLVEGS